MTSPLDGGALRDLRALRYNPPGFAKEGARRTTFQSALEQCEQFLGAARLVGYATRPVHLFYALSQASRAIVAASSRLGNQAWRVSGHGLSADTNATTVAGVAVTAAGGGLFAKTAEAMGLEPLRPDERVTLDLLWQLLPEAIFYPLTPDPMQSVLCFLPYGMPDTRLFAQAGIAWIPPCVEERLGGDSARVKEHFNRYPSLQGCEFATLPPPSNGVAWQGSGKLLELRAYWRTGQATVSELGVFCYRSDEDFVITPPVGSMSAGLHPILALWAVLLALSSLARYEPGAWSKLIDIDRSAEANAIEHLLDEAIGSLPAVIVRALMAS